MTSTFKIGQTYTMHSPCDWECTWIYKVIARTAKMVTLQDEHGEVKKCRVRVWDNEETCCPLGRYSMSPILGATKY